MPTRDFEAEGLPAGSPATEGLATEGLTAESLLDADAGIFVGHEPSWLVRSGISLVALALFLGLVFAALIRYPDVIQAPIILTTAQPPAELVSRIDGRIENILVHDNQSVVEGQPLLQLAGDVEPQQLRRLEQNVADLEAALEPGNVEGLKDLQADLFELGGLGELQLPCNRLARALREHQSFQRSTHDTAESRHTAAQRRRYLALQRQLSQKRKSYQRKLAMQQELLKGSRRLAGQGLLPTAQLAPVESRVLDQELALDDLEIQAETYEMQLQELEHRLQTLRIERHEQEQRLSGEVRNRLRELTSAMSTWRRKYWLTAPADGRVTLTRFWSAHQEVKRGEVVLIISREQGQRIGKIMVHQTGAGKIRAGQRVDIRLESFPAMEFGAIEATVSAVASVPGEDGYRVDVELPEPFVTTHDHRLPFTPNMAGSARILTENRLLLERLFDKLIYILNSSGA